MTTGTGTVIASAQLQALPRQDCAQGMGCICPAAHQNARCRRGVPSASPRQPNVVKQ